MAESPKDAPVKVCMIIKTRGLEYDDRLRKEVKTLRQAGAAVHVLALTDANRACAGSLYYGATYEEFDLRSRRESSKTGVIRSRWRALVIWLEFLWRLWPALRHEKPQVVWLHDPVMVVAVPLVLVLRGLGVVKRIVWDQHELPPEKVFEQPIMKSGFRWALGRVDEVVSVNDERVDYLLEGMQAGQTRNRVTVIRNYSDEEFNGLPRGELPGQAKQWLAGREFLLAQSGGYKIRHFESLANAVLNMRELPLVVVGGVDQPLVDALRAQWGHAFDEMVHFTGMIPQQDMVDYIDNAVASIIFYASSIPNSRYCEPNRLYQAVARGTPVVVGANPTMSGFVRTHGCGVVAEDDGARVESVKAALVKLLENLSEYKAKAEKASGAVAWENQAQALAALMSLD